MKTEIANSFWESLKYTSGPRHWYRAARTWIRQHLLHKESWQLLKQWFVGYPWDYCYLLNLEQAKLREMIAYHERNRAFVGWEKVVRDMKICVSLIDIITEKRSLFHFNGGLTFKEPDENGNVEVTGENLGYVCAVKVNMKNVDRFIGSYKESDAIRRVYEHSPHELYIVKAQALYHKIRAEREMAWWD